MPTSGARTENPSLVTHLECPECSEHYSADVPQTVCRCGSPLLTQYDLEQARAELRPEMLMARPWTMWRYRELLPVRHEANVISLGEGGTPLVPVPRLGRILGLDKLYLKNEGLNPTGTFKARGLSVALSMCKALGISDVAVSTAGSAGVATAAYAARAGLRAHVIMPADAPSLARNESFLTGAEVHLMERTSSKKPAELRDSFVRRGWFDLTALAEPYRLEGKKTMAFELAEQLGWEPPDFILHPTGGGVGIIAYQKGFEELFKLGWIDPRKPRPRLVAVQSEGCAPIVHALNAGLDCCEPWPHPTGVAPGILVGELIGDRLTLKALRATGGTAWAVSDADTLEAMRLLARTEGLFVGPEGAATIAAAGEMRESGALRSDALVVLSITSIGLRTPDLIETQLFSKSYAEFLGET